MQRYEIIPHTADIEIKVFGKDKKALFANALYGMSQVQQAEIEPGSTALRKIKVGSRGLERLLVDFLSEALYLSLVNREVYLEIKIKKFSNTEIEGELVGRKVARFNEDIKGVTYYDLKIYRNPQGQLETRIVFDV